MKRLVVILGLAAASLLSVVAGATAAGGVQLVEIGRVRFPDRGFLVDLPSGTKLHRQNVHVKENGRPVERFSIVPLQAAPQTFATILVIDASKSMRGRPYEAALDAARTFVARKNASEEIGVVTFNGSSQVLSAPTPATGAVKRALARPPALRASTHIYDAVARSLTVLEERDVSA